MGRLSVPGFPIPLTRGYSLLVQRFRCGPRLHALSAAPPGIQLGITSWAAYLAGPYVQIYIRSRIYQRLAADLYCLKLASL